MITEDLISYYKALLILQYASLANAVGTIDAYIRALVQDQIIQKVQDGFNLLTAIGAQLNLLGTYRGISRTAFGALPGSYWSLPSYTDTLPGAFLGWASYTDVNPPTVLWLQYNDLNALAYTLTDTQVRLLIQLKAEIDSWDGSLASLDTILFSFFGTYVTLTDSENMNILYTHQAVDPDPNRLWSIALLENIIPHPAGVAVSFLEV